MACTPHLRTLTLLVAIAAMGCEDKPTTPKEESSAGKDGGVSQKSAGVDKNLAEAVMAVAGGQGQGAAAGPPATGVFAKGAADKEVPPGAFPSLTLGNKGSEPTITFAASPWKPGKKREVIVQVSIQTGPQAALPTVAVTFGLEAAEPAPAAPATGGTEVLATVTSAKLAAEQPGQLPPGLAAEIAKLKGCKVRLEVNPAGASRTVGFEASSGVDEDLAQIPKSAADSLALALLPFPRDPVGAGAFWMVTSREPYLGLDALAYRMVKVEKVEGDRATLGVSTKRYVAGGQIGIAGLPPHEIQEFSGSGSGKLLVSAKDPRDLRGEATDVLLSNLAPQGGGPPGQRMGIQLQIRSVISGK